MTARGTKKPGSTLEAEVHRLRAQLEQRRAEAKSERELAERRGELAQELREELDSILLHHKKSERERDALRERAESAEAELTKLAHALSLKTNGAMDGTIGAAARLVNLLDRQLTARAEKAESRLRDGFAAARADLAAPGGGQVTTTEKLEAARRELSEVRERISKYEGGDRPPSPPVLLLITEQRLRGLIAELKRASRPEDKP